LQRASRIPLCPGCLRAPEPFTAEFFCAGCGTPFENAFPLDADGRWGLCRHGLWGFDAAYCYGPHEGMLRDWIHLYKYARVKTMAGSLGELLAAALPRHERVAPVPLHWRRRWERGFNQAELLARGIARKWHLPVVSALRRVRHTPTQTSLSNAPRRKNVTAAFAGRRSISCQRVLLVDDVLTTGSTAAALRRSGAARVVLLAAVRSDRRLPIPYGATVDSHPEETPNHGQ
jgi:ComF family protein